MIGIISSSVDIVGHSLFDNFKLALTNYFNTDLISITSAEDLTDVKTLLIVDEHFGPHVDIWKNDLFINTVNTNNIRVIIFNFEKIHSASFPWNIDHQKHVERFNILYQLVSDIDDA